MSSSQLTNSYFSEGLVETTNQFRLVSYYNSLIYPDNIPGNNHPNLVIHIYIYMSSGQVPFLVNSILGADQAMVPRSEPCLLLLGRWLTNRQPLAVGGLEWLVIHEYIIYI